MIIVQTPLRISLFGGGTDFPSYFQSEGGSVLSTSIDKYIFVLIKKRFDQMLRIGYTQTELVETIDEIQHELIRESLRKTGISQGVEITTMGDIPGTGTGLGSSSAVTVGALHAMYIFRDEIVTKERLAREACEIEIETLKKPIGIQDQFIASFGGLRFIEFLPGGEVKSRKIELSAGLKEQLDDSLLLFFTGIARQAGDILDEQKRNIQQRRDTLREMKGLAMEAFHALSTGDLNQIGCLLDESWQLKKCLASKITNGTIDAIYHRAIAAGATGGKITGAGGGGFILLYCPPERKECVRSALYPLQELPFRMEEHGTSVIFNYRRQ